MAALDVLNGAAEPLDWLTSKRMTADGYREQAGEVEAAIEAARLEIFRTVALLVSMDSKAPVEMGAMLGDVE
jgi:hypothetical protein